MNKVVIMCGGRGQRLRPLTDTVPKPLVPLNGKPVLGHIIDFYERSGYADFVLCTGYQGEKVAEFVKGLGSASRFEFSAAGEQAGILKRLHHARAAAGNLFFVAYGDTLINLALDQVLDQHQAGTAAVTITVASIRSPFGLVGVDNSNNVLSFQEKPEQLFYVGHMLMDASVLDGLDPALVELPDGSGLVALFQRLIAEGRLSMYKYRGPQITFNTHEELNQAEKDIVNFFTESVE